MGAYPAPCRQHDASWYYYKGTHAVSVGTVSKQLSDDMTEVMFKAGYNPVLSSYRKDKAYMINCNMTDNGKNRFSRVKQEYISEENYKGKVWCLTTFDTLQLV